MFKFLQLPCNSFSIGEHLSQSHFPDTLFSDCPHGYGSGTFGGRMDKRLRVGMILNVNV